MGALPSPAGTALPYPRSFLGLLLAGFTLVALPLAVGIASRAWVPGASRVLATARAERAASLTALVAVAIPVVVLTRLIYTQVVLSLVSDELARSTGIRVSRVNLLYLLLVAVVVAAGIQIVGTLLVGALVIVPAAAMKNVSSNLSRYAVLSGATGVVSAVAGISLSAALDYPAGPLVVVVGFLIFLLAIAVNFLGARRRRPSSGERAP